MDPSWNMFSSSCFLWLSGFPYFALRSKVVEHVPKTSYGNMAAWHLDNFGSQLTLTFIFFFHFYFHMNVLPSNSLYFNVCYSTLLHRSNKENSLKFWLENLKLQNPTDFKSWILSLTCKLYFIYIRFDNNIYFVKKYIFLGAWLAFSADWRKLDE